MVETRDVTWEATPDVGAPSPQLPVVPEQGGPQGLEDALELGRTEAFVFDPTTPLPRLERGIPHQLRAVYPITQASDDYRAEDAESKDASTASSESSDSDYSSRDGSDESTLKEEPWATRPPLTVGL